MTYVYACPHCGKEWEQEQGIKDPPIKECPHCGKQEVRRLIVSGNFVLKGSHWARDGY